MCELRWLRLTVQRWDAGTSPASSVTSCQPEPLPWTAAPGQWLYWNRRPVGWGLWSWCADPDKCVWCDADWALCMITTKDGQWERPQRTCGVCVCVCVAVGKAHRNKAKYMNTHTHKDMFLQLAVVNHREKCVFTSLMDIPVIPIRMFTGVLMLHCTQLQNSKMTAKIRGH